MAKRTTNKKASSSKSDQKLPGPHFVEQMMSGIFGGGGDRSFNAQEHAYNAMDAMANEDWDLAVKEAMTAIKIDPNCVDALAIMSRLGSENSDELIENLRRTVERGERAMGKKFFKENVGWFWGLHETRPYMRARAQLAELLHESGRINEAIEHFEDMLRLNPGDNQGLRYSLLGCYLEIQHLQGAERVFGEYPDEGSAMFAWARVLTDFLNGDEPAALKSLSVARVDNKHVEAYLTGRKKMPSEGPGYYSPGEPSEAIVCVYEIGAAWSAGPGAIDWLKLQTPKRQAPKRKNAKSDPKH
jgi:tetratricopeptide (TPR) repeat protein